MVERLTSVPCAICGKSVRIEDCKTDEIGRPVHEDCYVARLKGEESKKRKTATDK